MLDFKQLKRLQKQDLSALPEIKVSLLGDTATQFLSTAIKGVGVERGFRINLMEAEYNQVERQVMDPASDLYQHGAKYTVVFQSTHKLLEQYSLMDATEWSSLADKRLNFINTVCAQVEGKIICMNYPEIEDTIFGSYANKIEGSFTYQIRKLNYELMRLAEQFPNLFICDIAGLQNKFGRDWMFDSSVYVSTEMIFSIDALPYVASRVLDIVSAIEGRFKKCLILDLDNTVWGGIVGDDGWENIQIGHGLGIGKAFSEFQQWVKKLKNRGIVICVCSKNDEEKAKEPFLKNPEMVLRLEDVSVFVANWENKADNIRTIQQILNVGFDSMVFLDDNPAERAIVRENVPGVIVPELPEDPGDYLEYLYSLNLFETASYSNADKDRTKQYQVEAERVVAAKKFTNEADFLKSLNMVSVVEGFTKFNTPRVAQLSQRSNQFNLRTIRYTEDQISAMEQSDSFKTFSFTLEDKFGDNGLICVVILELKDNQTAFIDTWFMSCRVLKRGMENFTLNTIVKWCRENGIKTIIGEYIPTLKNGMVKKHYPNLTFAVTDKENQWSLDVDKYIERECYIAKK
ncbi:MAG: HAD-IIIC family phosphatase [Bacteroidales bacterium]|nr:HAD-IIIC family phosphatase [Bacteroidales bacterium]